MRQSWLRCKALRQAFNKAKDTFISTLANKRRRFLTKQNAQIFVNALGNVYLMLILLALKTNHQLFVSNIEAVIDQVANRVTVNGTNQISRLETCPVGRTFGHNLTHPSIHFWHSSISSRLQGAHFVQYNWNQQCSSQ